jgi:hypothetical protein
MNQSNQLRKMLAMASREVPGLRRVVLVWLSEGVLLTGLGGDSIEYEVLERTARACWVASRQPLVDELREFLFVDDDELVAVQLGTVHTGLALAAACTKAANPALVLNDTRHALRAIESDFDPGVL